MQLYLCSAFVCFTLFPAGISAQHTEALNGTVTAADGSELAAATVTAIDSSGFAHKATTAQDGSFSVSNLSPGTYTVEINVPGFRRLIEKNIPVTADNPIGLKFRMQKERESATVVVAAIAPLTNDRGGVVVQAYTSRVTSELPIQDNNHQQLVELMPGITPPATSQGILTDPQRNRIWNANGQPAQANNQLIDGLENQEAVRGVQIHMPVNNAVQQMDLATANYDPSQGRAGGSILNATLKSGANKLHSELFAMHSNDWLRARNYFDPTPLPQPVYTSNQSGAVVAGALRPNRTFFLFSDQGDNVKDGTPAFTTVPQAAFASGNFSSLPGVTIYNPFSGSANGTGRIAFVNNTIPASLIDRRTSALLPFFPEANVSGVENNYFANQAVTNDGVRVDAKMDQRFDEHDLLFLRYSLSHYSTAQASLLPAIGEDGGFSRLRAHEGAIGFTHNFGPAALTDIRAAFDRYSNPIYGSINTGLPEISIDGMAAVGMNPAYPQVNKEDNWNIANNWTYRMRNNDLRFGLDYDHVRADGFQSPFYGPTGGYTFSAGATSTPGAALGPFGSYANSLAAFLLGTPTVSGISASTYVPSYISRQYGAYIANRVNITRRLTLDIGVRYDYFWPVEPRNNAANYFVYHATGNVLAPIGNRTGGIAGNSRNLAPRAGLAYRLNDRIVVRAGYGWSYWNPELAFSSSHLIPATIGTQTGVAGSYAVAGTFGAIPAAVGGAVTNQAFYVSPAQMHTPYVQFYKFDIQQDLSHGMLFDVAYVGNMSRDLPFTRNINAAPPGTGTAGEQLAAFGHTAPVYERGTGFDANYNALQVNITKRFSHGIAFTAAYTYSKSLDYGAGLTPFLNNNNPYANYGPSNFDRTHIFTLTHNWQLPVGAGTSHLSTGLLGHVLGPWELDGIYRSATGRPLTLTAAPTLCQCPGNTPLASALPELPIGGFAPGFFGLLAPYEFPASAFGQPGRNAVRGPGFLNYDLALTRSFAFGEAIRIHFRVEAYNLTNTAHFGNPITDVNSANFGLAMSTAPGLDARLFQAVMRVVF